MSNTKNLIKDLKTLVKENENKLFSKRLSDVAPQPGIASVTGIGRQTSEKSLGGGGSISTPLTEQSRTYHADKIATSSDGLFTFHYANVNEINFNDANRNPVKLIFSNP